jgi:hypothetical protein
MTASGLQSYEYNPLGDIVAGRAGTVESTGYAPYGKGETQNTTVEPRFGYRGEIQIGNRVHLRARDLNTATARFDRKDPNTITQTTTPSVKPIPQVCNQPTKRSIFLSPLARALVRAVFVWPVFRSLEVGVGPRQLVEDS